MAQTEPKLDLPSLANIVARALNDGNAPTLSQVFAAADRLEDEHARTLVVERLTQTVADAAPGSREHRYAKQALEAIAEDYV